MRPLAGGVWSIVFLTGIFAASAADSPALSMARQLNSAFIEVAENVSPSVVVIKVAQREQSPTIDEDNPYWDLVPKEFRRRMEEEQQNREQKKEKGGPPVYNGRGSGVILREDGYILTNFHVVEEAEAIQVRLRDGRRFTATVRGTDPQSDVAVLKIEATNLPAAKLGDSSAVRVGEFAVAIGAPFDLDYSVTYGHVSAKGRSHVVPAYGLFSQGASMDQDFIQTDASINPGNSGGPLVNLYGEVIGINTLIRGLHTGIGFAVPINLARDVSSKLISDGKFVRSWLGIGIRGVREDEDSEQLVAAADDGVLVTEIRPDGPARNSDLKAGDIILSVDGHAVGTATQLRNEVRTKPAGSHVTLDVVRMDEKKRSRKLKVAVTPEAWPEKPTRLANARPSKTTPPLAAKDLGFVASGITAELKKRHDLSQENGVVVTEIDGGLAKGKLRKGDLIVGVNHRTIESMEDFDSALGQADAKRGILLEIIRDGSKQSEVLRPEKE